MGYSDWELNLVRTADDVLMTHLQSAMMVAEVISGPKPEATSDARVWPLSCPKAVGRSTLVTRPTGTLPPV
jgi:hypothetical protein